MKANPNFIFLKDKVKNQRFTLLQGGTRSGKTFSTIYYFIWLCENYTGLEIDIVRDTFTALKSTVWKDFKQVLVNHNLYDVRNHNRTDHIYNLNGNIISYYGADDPGKIHGRSRDILWLNEANQLDEETVDQLFPRTRYRVIMDYNPAMPTEHWLDPYIENNPPLITTYLDNPFLTKDQVNDIEAKKNNKYWWSVYGTGERTKPTGVIFENWDYGTFDSSLPYIYAMDFGYVNDPTTLVKVAIDKKLKKLYISCLLFEKELSTIDISMRLERLVGANELIVADCAEPRLISEIQAKGFNMVACTKGPDSIRLGLVKMMDYEIIVERDDTETVKELNNYVWNDRKSNTPIDKFNHIIDAVRYGVDELSQESTFFIV